MRNQCAQAFQNAREFFEPFRRRRVFVTGGTGFFGKWLLLAFNHANTAWGLDIKVSSLSRRPERLLKENPEIGALPGIEFIAGDVRSFSPPSGTFDLVIHAATEASAALERDDPEEMRSVIVDGTRHVLEFAGGCGAGRVLMISSGGVYGQTPPSLERIPESYNCAPYTAYGQGKLEAEKLCAASGLECPIARCFAFVGPYLPIDTHFAVGNFIRDALAGRDIVINGDGSPLRSYMHASDLVLWLLRILSAGKPGRAYNVGSEEAISIKDLAQKVRDLAGSRSEVKVLGKPVPGAANRYVPDTARARSELGLVMRVGLNAALKDTLDAYAG